MKQILQDLSSGKTEVVEAPAPTVSRGKVLIDTSVTLISTGTERMLVDFGRANMVQKAKQQPEKVKQVISKAKTDGLITTIDAVKSKLSQPIELGYSNVGIVKAVGDGVDGFKIGDRVLSNGRHADVVSVPKNLVAKIPDGVADDMAAFTVVASIGLQGVRLAEPTLGETIVVTGVGLIGLLVVQLLVAQGCHVLAIDIDSEKLELAKKYGANICNLSKGEDPVVAAMLLSRGDGVDAVVIAASTKLSDPVSQAASMLRKRGRIILVGVTGLELNRADFYEKELSFQVSCSYGPGRYDPNYEDRGQDYPLGFVRWTENRNFQAILSLMDRGLISTDELISHRIEFENAPRGYDLLTTDKSAMGIMLDYSSDTIQRHEQTIELAALPSFSGTDPVVGFLGAGNYASRVLIPAFKEVGAAVFHTIVSAGGTSATVHGRKNGFANATTDIDSVFQNPEINTVAIVTRHNSHADLTVRALEAGKHVFVEKPLAITTEELSRIKKAYKEADCHLMVGYNRRFAPQAQTMKKLLASVKEPKTFVMIMNAGKIPSGHWTQDCEIGGGRIIGEACHHIDLMRFLAGSKIVSVQARRIGNNDAMETVEDKAVIILGFEDGSFGTIHYLANGGVSFPKERIEVFAAGRTLQLDNFRKLRGYNWPNFKKENLMRMRKGRKACASAFLDAIASGKPTPIPSEELFEVAEKTIEATELLRSQT